MFFNQQTCEHISRMLIAMSGYKIALGLFIGWLLAIFIGERFAELVKRINKEFKESLPESTFPKWDEFLFDEYFIKATRWLGRFEVTLFYICLFVKLEGIGVWLAFKVAAKWESWANIMKMPKKIKRGDRESDDFEYLIFRNGLATTVMQRFLIGTIGNILAAVVGMGLFCIIRYLPEQKEMNQMKWMIDTPWVWLCLAILFSIFWGIYGCNNEIRKGKIKKGDRIEITGIFLSEFIGSLIGWACLYILIVRFRNPNVIVGSFDVFLGIVAVVGITGYSYKIVDALKKP